MQQPTTILLADDHAVVRKGLAFLAQSEPDLEVVGEARDGREAVALFEKLRPRVVVLDLSMPGLNGLEAAAKIVALDPAAATIVLSMHTDETYIMRALQAGVRGYVSKDSAEDEIIDAIRAVAAGRTYLSAALARGLLLAADPASEKPRDRFETLTPREKEILDRIADGKTNKEIATALGLSPHTVETHRSNLMQKLDLHTVAEVVHYAVRRKLRV